jgi:hypothetical protein
MNTKHLMNNGHINTQVYNSSWYTNAKFPICIAYIFSRLAFFRFNCDSFDLPTQVVEMICYDYY